MTLAGSAAERWRAQLGHYRSLIERIYRELIAATRATQAALQEAGEQLADRKRLRTTPAAIRYLKPGLMRTSHPMCMRL